MKMQRCKSRICHGIVLLFCQTMLLRSQQARVVIQGPLGDILLSGSLAQAVRFPTRQLRPRQCRKPPSTFLASLVKHLHREKR